MRYELKSLHRSVVLTLNQVDDLANRALIRRCDGCTEQRLVTGTQVYHLESIFADSASKSTGWAEVEDALAALAKPVLPTNRADLGP